jgi:hypothetical protein
MATLNPPVAPVRLSDHLKTLKTTYETYGAGFMTYIKDHKENIRSNGELVLIDADRMNMYQYRPGAFLRDIKRISPGLEWIFLYINDFSSSIDFNDEIRQVYVPSETHIDNLYIQYMSALSARQKNI